MGKIEISEEEKQVIKRWVKTFRYSEMTDEQQDIAKPFAELASMILIGIPSCRDKDLCLEQLLLSRTYALRAAQ